MARPSSFVPSSSEQWALFSLAVHRCNGIREGTLEERGSTSPNRPSLCTSLPGSRGYGTTSTTRNTTILRRIRTMIFPRVRRNPALPAVR